MFWIALALIPLAVYASPPSTEPASKTNYPANFQVAEGIDLFIGGDYLYWGATADGVYFAESHSIAKIDPSFTSGFRVDVGVNFPKAGSELILYWTNFSSHARQEVNKTNLPLWAEPAFDSYASALSSTAHWKLGLNLFDIEWDRASWFGGHFSLRPFFGIRGAFIDEKMKSTFTYDPVSIGSVDASVHFKGGGLRAGGEGRWVLPLDFSLYGLLSGSLLYGQFQPKSVWALDGVTQGQSQDSFLQNLNTMQMLFGVAWDTHFAKDKLHFEVHMGWEQNIFFHFNRFNHYLGDLSEGFFFEDKGNLCLQGLSVGGRFDF
ncbi:MAG: hypothetical protein RLZZ453_445 [Chlamydiota bacterium]